MHTQSYDNSIYCISIALHDKNTGHVIIYIMIYLYDILLILVIHYNIKDQNMKE